MNTRGIAIRRALAALAASVCLASAAFAEKAADVAVRFTIADYFRLQRVSELALSSDGAQLVYVVDSFAPETRERMRRVYRQSLEGNRDSVLLADLAQAWSFAWVPGTHDLAFLSTGSGASQVFVRDARTGTDRQFTRSTHPVETFLFAPDGRTLAYTTRAETEHGTSLYEQFREGARGILVDPATASSHDFLNPHWNALVRPKAPTLWVVRDGGQARELTLPGEPTGDEGTFFWSSDSTALSVTFVGRDVPLSWMRGEHTSVGVFDVASGRFDTIAPALAPDAGRPWVNYRGGEWIPGRKQVLLRRVVEEDPWVSDSFPSWAILDLVKTLAPGELRWHPIEAYPRGLQFLPMSANRVLVENTVQAVRSIFELRPEGLTHVPWVVDTPGSHSLLRASADFRTVAFVSESLVCPPEIYVRRGRSKPRRLTHLNERVASRVAHRSRSVRWKARDGATVQGWLLEPIDAKPPWPTITHVHGGPAFPYPDSFAAYFAYWPYPLEVYPGQGIAVFLPNYRGTHTFGRRIASPIAQEPAQDILDGLAHLIAMGVADAERLGISGHSHGAVVGPAAMGRYQKFAAASFAEGVANSVVMYELMSGDANREIHDPVFGASLYQDPQRYLADSPDLHLAGIETASLFEAGANTAGLLMLGYPKATRRAGAPTEFIVYPRSGHNLVIPSLQAESAERNLDWFTFWLLGRVDPDPLKDEQYARWQAMKRGSVE